MEDRAESSDNCFSSMSFATHSPGRDSKPSGSSLIKSKSSLPPASRDSSAPNSAHRPLPPHTHLRSVESKDVSFRYTTILFAREKFLEVDPTGLRLNYEQYKEFLALMGFEWAPWSDLLFKISDTNKDGLLDFKEVFCCCVLFSRGSFRDKVGYILYYFDDNAEGLFNMDEFRRLYEYLSSLLQLDVLATKLVPGDSVMTEELLVAALADLDPNHTGIVSLEVVKKWLLKRDDIAKSFDEISFVFQKTISKSVAAFASEMVMKQLEECGVDRDNCLANAESSLSTITKFTKPKVGAAKKSMMLGGGEFMIPYEDIVFEEAIGSGAFAEVWKGTWVDTPVAVKRIKRSQFALNTDLSDAEIYEQCVRFVQEVRVWSHLRHPNLVLLMACCASPEKPLCVVSELHEMGTLEGLLENEATRLSLKEKIEICLHVARGMKYLHTRATPILHRDLKSGNVLIRDPSYFCIICDFGEAQLHSEVLNLVKAEHKTEHGSQLIGTPQYMPPEVMRSGKEAFTEASDVYSFGVLMWEVFTQRSPWKGMNPTQIMFQVMRRKKRPEFKEEHEVSEDIKALIEVAWDDEPANRPSFSDILGKLKKIKAEVVTP
mmetsp:Transcript_2497/g.6647  ORF Transcript_2497/g.6647 Transcript_2497/m.6647 type:complete len:602 (+) Transcript_2497:99-1904(+)|eukprot:CAMPEP_0174895158 /NCGR_PEP_ID=MMETSP0167-20121228/9620_1 /TAXON_ID=38298 /ORGANISM="Rhodella maculata, Strain CCMP736" /LENGTH=601 /DNA_ID=CAMNT_0016134421 /DNA_START=83 /DNA_END=1888 /DNA_ORIENTATION=+